MLKKLFLFVCLAGALALAQSPTVVQQHQTHLDSGTNINATAAVNNAVTLTIPAPPAGQYIYISEIDLQVVNDATGAVTQQNVAFTSTNLNSWQFLYSSANAANTSSSFGPIIFPTGLKAPSPGTKVTIVSPAANTHAAYNINVVYWIAP